MPITSPIPGAGDVGTFDNTYISRMSVEIGNVEKSPALQSLSVSGPSEYESLQGLTVVDEKPIAALQSVELGTIDEYPAFNTIEVFSGDSFLVLADILAEVLSGPSLGSYGPLQINAKVTVNGNELPIKSFDYDEPQGRLGSILNCRVAVPDPDLVPSGASVDFGLVITRGGDEHYYSLLENGKVVSRNYKITNTEGRPIDEVNFGAVDVISDKMTLGPRRPVVLYDPSRVPYSQVETKVRDSPIDESGRPILPVVEPKYGLTMKQVLNRAYTGQGGYSGISALNTTFIGSNISWALAQLITPSTDQQGCGFDRVITNVKDYKVKRADFTLTEGWHGGATSVVGMYPVEYFSRDNYLYIINPWFHLPYNMVPHQLSLDVHKTLNEDVTFTPDRNAVLLTYQASENDGSLVYTVKNRPTEISESGSYGSDDYVKTETRVRYRAYYYIEDPLTIVKELDEDIEIKTYSSVAFYSDEGELLYFNPMALTHVEETVNRYDGDLKVGHTKTVQGAIWQKPGQTGVFLSTTERETCNIYWKEDPINPGKKIQDRTITRYEAQCYLGETAMDVVGPNGYSATVHQRFPAVLAQESGAIVTPSRLLPGLQTVETITEQLRLVGGNQYDVQVIRHNHLTGTISRSITQPTMGDSSVDPYATRSVTILLRDEESEAEIGPRIPVSVNAYELPREQALELGQWSLRLLRDPMKAMPIDLVGVDFSVVKGSVVTGQKRSGYTGNYFVAGRSFVGRDLGTDGHRIQQSLDTIELLSQ